MRLPPVSATVPAVDGSVMVTSAVDAGPIRVTLLVPLSLSSKKSQENRHSFAPFLSCNPALTTGVVVRCRQW